MVKGCRCDQLLHLPSDSFITTCLSHSQLCLKKEMHEQTRRQALNNVFSMPYAGFFKAF